MIVSVKRIPEVETMQVNQMISLGIRLCGGANEVTVNVIEKDQGFPRRASRAGKLSCGNICIKNNLSNHIPGPE